jgi:anti-sigma factor RsiW
MKTWLNGYADGELDLARSLEVELHMEGCPACAASLHKVQELRKAVGEIGLYYNAPDGFRRRFWSASEKAYRPRPTVGDWALKAIAVGVVLALNVFVFWALFLGVVQLINQFRPGPSAEELLAQEVVSNHVRSLLVGKDPRVDVESSDQHEVKPWFIGRVPFSPLVRNLDAEGYHLIGGRLEYLDNRKVAALVYKHRKHPITLLTWGADGAADEPPGAQTRQGFQEIHWVQNGMNYWVVSDLNEADLLRFVELLRR